MIILFTILLTVLDPKAASTRDKLVGAWKLDKVIYQTDRSSMESPLPGSYDVRFTLTADGTCTFQENGTTATKTWSVEEVTPRLVLHQRGLPDLTFNLSVEGNGSWSYQIASIDLKQKKHTRQEDEVLDYATTVALANNMSLEGASYLRISLHVVKQQGE